MKTLALAIFCAFWPYFAVAQSQGAITSSQCISIDVTNQSTVGIQVTGTWTGTLQPEIAVQGQTAQNIQVTPSTSSTAQTTITANGFYQARVAGGSTFFLCGATVASGTANVFLNATQAVSRNRLGGAGPVASFVQATRCQGAGGIGNCTTAAINVTSGHALAFCSESNGNGTLNSLTISTGTNTLASFTNVITPIAAVPSLDCRWIASTNASGSTTFKATWSVTNVMQIIVFELIVPTGLDGTVPAVTTYSTTQTTIVCPSYTTVHANAMAFCAGLSTSGTGVTSFTASSGFTIPAGGSNATNAAPSGAIAYEAGITAGTPLSPSVTPNTSVSFAYAVTFAFS